jgi:peptidoglycan/xylan/chitin deacetylase (PgdA/CDA1 family)
MNSLFRITPLSALLAGVFLTAIAMGISAMLDGQVAVSQVTPVMTPPARAVDASRLVVLAYHDVRVDADTNQDSDAITPDHFIAQLEWLRGHGWTFISWKTLQAARQQGTPLPRKAVMLTVDDGLKSAYTTVWPLIDAYRVPAVFAIVDAWSGMKDGEKFDYNGESCTRACFADWANLREMAGDPLVTLASHSDNLHKGIAANPQGNLEPAARVLMWTNGQYETEAAYEARLNADLDRSVRTLQQNTGVRVSLIAWPYGSYNASQVRLASNHGLQSLGLSGYGPVAAKDPVIERVLVGHDMEVEEFATLMTADPQPDNRRAVVLSLKDLDAPTSSERDIKLGHLIDRVKGLGLNEVWFRDVVTPGPTPYAFAPMPQSGLLTRADLFNRVVWQLRTRAGASSVVVLDAPLATGKTGAKDARPDPTAKVVSDLARAAMITAVVLPESTPRQTLQSAHDALLAWQPAAEIRLAGKEPVNHSQPGQTRTGQTSTVQSVLPDAPTTWTVLVSADPTRLKPVTDAINHAIEQGAHRVVVDDPAFLAPDHDWVRLRSALSNHDYPYKTP